MVDGCFHVTRAGECDLKNIVIQLIIDSLIVLKFILTSLCNMTKPMSQSF